jgi:hypothetical protein
VTILLAIKRLACALGLGSRLIEFCETCGRRVDQTWRAPDDLWLEITGRAVAGVRCVPCFDDAAMRRGLILRWRADVAHVRGRA